MTEKEKMKQTIIKFVEENGYTDTLNIVLKIEEVHGRQTTDMYGRDETIITIISELIKEGKIIELNYINPRVPYRVKSLYFATGTKITIGETL